MPKFTPKRHCSKCFIRYSSGKKWYKAKLLGLTPDSYLCQSCAMKFVYNPKRREARHKEYMRDKLMAENNNIRRQLARLHQRYANLKVPSVIRSLDRCGVF